MCMEVSVHTLQMISKVFLATHKKCHADHTVIILFPQYTDKIIAELLPLSQQLNDRTTDVIEAHTPDFFREKYQFDYTDCELEEIEFDEHDIDSLFRAIHKTPSNRY